MMTEARDDETGAIGLTNLFKSLHGRKATLEEQEVQRGIDQTMRETIKSPPYTPQWASGGPSGPGGSGWQKDPPVSTKSNLELALNDEWGPLRKGRDDPAQWRMWMLRWDLVTGADRDRVEWSWRDFEVNRETAEAQGAEGGAQGGDASSAAAIGRAPRF
jgi:hypothetical protein